MVTYFAKLIKQPDVRIVIALLIVVLICRDYLFKIVILGDGGVGKTALLEKFTNDSFMEAYVPTIGVDFVRKSFIGI